MNNTDLLASTEALSKQTWLHSLLTNLQAYIFRYSLYTRYIYDVHTILGQKVYADLPIGIHTHTRTLTHNIFMRTYLHCSSTCHLIFSFIFFLPHFPFCSYCCVSICDIVLVVLCTGCLQCYLKGYCKHLCKLGGSRWIQTLRHLNVFSISHWFSFIRQTGRADNINTNTESNECIDNSVKS